MAAKRHERTSARRAALQVLYTSEITDESPAAIAEGNSRLDEDGPLPEYALKLVLGVESHRCAIDNHLAATSENWSLARMPIVDRSILRLATFEMMYIDDVPTSVTINEAVELAKDFGGEDESHRFVNGILGRIARCWKGRKTRGRSRRATPRCPPMATLLPTASPLTLRIPHATRLSPSRPRTTSRRKESSPMALESYDSFEAVKTRLDEIVDAVSDDELALDDALALYEEAVGLGLRASDLLEDNIETQQSVEGADEVSDEPSDDVPAQETGAPVSA